jgi:transcriptional regulator with XRE-family HTH domain
MARRAGTSQPVISAYERGKRDPTTSTLRRLLMAAGERLDLDASPLPASEPGAAAVVLSDEQRAAQLVDLMLLGEAFPFRRTGELTFPRVSSS